jgi:hypothetical protein
VLALLGRTGGTRLAGVHAHRADFVDVALDHGERLEEAQETVAAEVQRRAQVLGLG